ncbi:MAG: aminotransferase class III-fold pyridoxal phosphate-dependent enzyme [Armatimonadetes bacterium]|nr:aminotransferase class III-fold pyridoxal phosphate-dependent enzyme [Armatimonadota bacterium]
MRWQPSEGPSKAPFFFTWTAQSRAEPVEITGGQGSWFTTADGKRWLDLGSLIYQANLGHGHPRMVEAICRQARELCLTVPNAVFPSKIELAEKLLDLAPPGFDKVFFTLGGAESNENALKIARMVTGRHKLMSRYRSYHGATMGALSLTGDYRRPPLEPGLAGAVHVLDCYCEHCPFGQVQTACRLECATHIDQVLELEGAGTVAAVFLEPIPGANGVLVPPAGYWKRVREACDRHGTLLVADEVLTGFGRTGRWFAIEHEGVVPDLISLGKGLTGGYATLGAVLVHQRVSRYFDDHKLYAGLTGYAHPVACATALEAIRVYEDEDLMERAARLEQPLMEGLRRVLHGAPERVRFLRGRGLLAALELEPDAAFLSRLREEMRREQIYVHFREADATVILSPPLCITEEELEEGIARLERALTAAR